MGMGSSIIKAIFIRFLAGIMVIFTIIVGIVLGFTIAETSNIRNQENFYSFAPALPTRILDINGNLITEFAADERRVLVSINDLPQHLIYAVLAREDPDFFNHPGFSIRGIARAAWGQITGQGLGGGSTITQQIAGSLYTNRGEQTIRRKIEELWWALQMERRYTKNEILEIYLNQINTGPGVFGVEAASQFFFGHSAKDITLAESALLVVLFSNPSRYNPINNPNEAMDRQRFVLNRMIEFGFTTPEEADASFNEYWQNYDFTRVSTAAYFNRADEAPWFSEYVRRELDSLMYGTMNYYTDGFTVHTTLNLRHQEAAVAIMQDGLVRANTEYARTSSARVNEAERAWRPVVQMLSLHFNLVQIHSTTDDQLQEQALTRYIRTLNPVVDMMSMIFGIPDLKLLSQAGFARQRITTERNVIEGALISIENDTGFITAIVGGSRFDETNQLIRATQANLQPGSSFKPLYYSAAIDSRLFTAVSQISDMPVVFHNEDGTPYIPSNFMGSWSGSVLLVNALSQSMNVASLKVLDEIGFDAAINRSAALLGYSNQDEIRRRFPRAYPLGLGVNSTSPIRMAQAYAVFANQGREVIPIAIRTLEDRNGQIIMDLERDLRQDQNRRRNSIQIVSPQNAFIMTSMLRRTVQSGTLANPTGWGAKTTFRDEQGRNFQMPMAGKTGTTQNWADAWTVGYSPYYTTAVWFGFDRPGNSLGVTLTGSTLAGYVWADYMREIHMGLPFRDFVRPPNGLIDVTVCARSGLLRVNACNEGSITMPFLVGTQPLELCGYHGNTRGIELGLITLESETRHIDTSSSLQNLNSFLPVIRDDFSTQNVWQPGQQTQNIFPVVPDLFPSNPFLDDIFSFPQIPEYNPDPVPIIIPELTYEIIPEIVPEIIPEYVPENLTETFENNNLEIPEQPEDDPYFNTPLAPPSFNPILD